MNSDSGKSELSGLERLAALLREDKVDVESMNSDQLADYLKDNKVSMAAPQKRFEIILRKAQAKRKLEVAHQHRLDAVAKAKEMFTTGSSAVEEIRERVQAMIEKFKQHAPEQAQVYAREFEKATPEDLMVLEEDLMLLESDQSDHGKTDK